MIATIRRATLNDAEELSSLSKTTFAETFSGTCTEDDMQYFLETYFNVEQVAKELADENDYYFFAEVDGAIAGYVRFKEEHDSFPEVKKWKSIELKRIYVTQPFHGKGIAQQLISFVETFAKKRGYGLLWLGVWEHNYKAKRFYEKSGFVDSGYTHDFPIGTTPQTDNWLWKFLPE
ncbi:MAG: GNAT family N-acetyltransferase [Ferruginibacter sp.]